MEKKNFFGFKVPSIVLTIIKKIIKTTLNHSKIDDFKNKKCVVYNPFDKQISKDIQKTRNIKCIAGHLPKVEI